MTEQWLQRLLLLVLVLGLAACAARMQLLPAVTVPPADALNGTPAQSLLERANQAASAGREQAASLYLERALRLAPDSSWLYKRMADLRLSAGDAHAAEGFSRHALRNAEADDRRYRASLYDLLATCLSRQGEQASAEQVRKQAQALLAE